MLRPDVAGRARHSCFAYGSNLCVRQMAQRCPGAVNPRPAMLGDHDWLINERGVAPVEAWVFIDHRVDPGAPRPGYLDRIVDGAVHHGLPHRWIEFLRRWDPAHWPRRTDKASSRAPRSLSELLAEPGIVEVSTLRSRFGFMAIHGGGLEEMTD